MNVEITSLYLNRSISYTPFCLISPNFQRQLREISFEFDDCAVDSIYLKMNKLTCPSSQYNLRAIAIELVSNFLQIGKEKSEGSMSFSADQVTVKYSVLSAV